MASLLTKTLLRRVQRRLQVLQMQTPEAYIARLTAEPLEVTALFRDLLINVTSFFRDPEAFDSLAENVVARLFGQRGADDTVRVWIPGCATGEEVYSIAMLLRERMAGLDDAPRVQVFATDLDEHALAVARAARYPVALLDGVTQARRERFFVADGGSYVIAKEVRDLCIFSPHSLIRDPPFSRVDLVSCRNLLIYLRTRTGRAFARACRRSGTPGSDGSVQPQSVDCRPPTEPETFGRPVVAVAQYRRIAGSVRSQLPRALPAICVGEAIAANIPGQERVAGTGGEW